MRIYGKNPVLERLKTNHRSIQKIFIEYDHPEAPYIQKKAKQWGIPVVHLKKFQIEKWARNKNTQGLMMEIDEFSYRAFPDLLAAAIEHQHTIVFIDEINDPQNLGGIIRSLACLGAFSLCLPTHKSVHVTESVLRVACGGENYVPMSVVGNLNQAIGKAKEEGFQIVGTVVKGGQDLFKTLFSFPLGLVVGSEQKGIRDVVRKNLDMVITIPMAQERMSMNVSHATTLLCYEIIRQKGQGR